MKTLFALSVGIITGCSVSGISGTASETTNSAVVGTVYRSDGTTPAEGAIVRIRPVDTIVIFSSNLTVETGTTTTDADGFFTFDQTFDPGTYVIEAEYGDTNRALIASVTVTENSSTESVTLVLKHPGAITGTIHLTEGGDPRGVFIYAFGLDRFTTPDTNGEFTFDTLAEAVYDLRIFTVSNDYAVLDVFGVPVRSAEITELDTLTPLYTGIPKPKRLSWSYDTLKQIVSLSWAKCDTELVKGYRMYRKRSDSDFVRITTSPINDTVFADSFVVQDATYEYRITAVDEEGNEGHYSTGVSVVAAGGYVLVKGIGTRGTGDGQFQEPRGITGDSAYVYIADYLLGKIEKYDMQGTFIGGFTTAFKPFNLLLSRRKNLVICSFSNVDPHLIIRTDTSGVVIDTFEINVDVQEPFDLAQDADGNFFIANRVSNKVVVYNEKGDYLKTFGGPGTENGRFNDICGIGVDDRGFMYVTDGGNNRVQKLRSDGVFDNTWGTEGNAIEGFSQPFDISVGSHDFLFVLERTGRRLKKIDPAGNVMSRFGTAGNEPGQFGRNLNCIWLDYMDRIWISEGMNSCRVQIFKPL